MSYQQSQISYVGFGIAGAGLGWFVIGLHAAFPGLVAGLVIAFVLKNTVEPVTKQMQIDNALALGRVQEQYYKTITDEISQGKQEPVLWTKALADGDGDKDRTAAAYIKLRVEQLTAADVQTGQLEQAVKNERGEIYRIQRQNAWEKLKADRSFWLLLAFFGLMGLTTVFMKVLREF